MGMPPENLKNQVMMRNVRFKRLNTAIELLKDGKALAWITLMSSRYNHALHFAIWATSQPFAAHAAADGGANQVRLTLPNLYDMMRTERPQHRYLGGDIQHTHLVKGLDMSLLAKASYVTLNQNSAIISLIVV
jgi:hypothetical protein